MKKGLIIFILVFSLIVIIKYFFSDYNLNYKVNGYDVITKLDGKVLYFEISKDNKFNFDIYVNNKKKIYIKEIKELDIDKYKCIVPVIREYETYPLCYSEDENVNVDYNIIDHNALLEYKSTNYMIDKPEKDFIFYNNIDNNVYIALWTYKGYTIMNNNDYTNISIFNKDRYDNDLAYQINNTIYMPNYDMEHEFDELISLDIMNKKYKTIKLDSKIDYDSYVVGNIKNKLYIYDNKKSILLEINTKDGKTKTISSSEKGYVKYVNGKFKECSKNEYKIDKITFETNNDSIYRYELNEGTYKTYNKNNSIKTKIVEKDIDIVFEYKDNLYYKLDNYFYIYNPKSGSNKIFYDYELAFNNSKSVFVYIN